MAGEVSEKKPRLVLFAVFTNAHAQVKLTAEQEAKILDMVTTGNNMIALCDVEWEDTSVKDAVNQAISDVWEKEPSWWKEMI